MGEVVMVWVSDTQSLSISIKSDQIRLARSGIDRTLHWCDMGAIVVLC